MKKSIFLALCLVLIGTGAAMADTLVVLNSGSTATIPINQNNKFYNTPTNYIGDANKFITSQASFETSGVNAGLLTITTNWDPVTNDGYLGAYTAMLFISTTGGTNWNYAINLDYTNTNKNLADVYVNPLAINSSWNANIYGKYYNTIGQTVPVLATANLDPSVEAYVTWAYGPSHDNNTVTVDLNDILGIGAWSFFWGTATCGNGPITGGFDTGVPLPPSALLLGSGLLGLIGLGWRRKSKA